MQDDISNIFVLVPVLRTIHQRSLIGRVLLSSRAVEEFFGRDYDNRWNEIT
jgi:hypothetical protein